MLIEKPIAFESLDFLPGFPTISKYACNPWSTFFRAGACANPPIAVGRERTSVTGWPAVQAAVLAAGGVMPSYSGAMSGLGKGGDRHIRRQLLNGLGAAEHGGAVHTARRYEGNWPSASTSRNDHPNYRARLGDGCGCGGSCGGCGGGGLGQLDASSIMSWVTTNWMPLAVGAAAVWFLKRR